MQATRAPSVRPSLLGALGLGVGAPSFGGLCWALCLVQARRARRGPHPYEVPHFVDGLHRFAGVAPVGAQPLRVVWLGDSLAAGLGADDAADTPALATAEALRRDCHIRMLAVPGAKIGDVLDAQIPALVSLDAPETRPDLVVIAAGANDVSAVTPRAEFVADLAQVLAACHPTPVLLLSLPDIGCATRLGQPLRTVASARARWLDRAQRSTAAAFDNVLRVDIASLPPGVTRAQARSMLCADRFHPSGAGYRVWAERIAGAASALLGDVAHRAA